MLPGDKNGAWHSADLWYWFGTLDNCWRPFEAKDYEISDIMTTKLCNFAQNQVPNDKKTPIWKSTNDSKNTMFIGEGEVGMRKPSKFKLTITMLTNKSVGE